MTTLLILAGLLPLVALLAAQGDGEDTPGRSLEERRRRRAAFEAMRQDAVEYQRKQEEEERIEAEERERAGQPQDHDGSATTN